jgi:hypothetical protein
MEITQLPSAGDRANESTCNFRLPGAGRWNLGDLTLCVPTPPPPHAPHTISRSRHHMQAKSATTVRRRTCWLPSHGSPTPRGSPPPSWVTASRLPTSPSSSCRHPSSPRPRGRPPPWRLSSPHPHGHLAPVVSSPVQSCSRPSSPRPPPRSSSAPAAAFLH